LKAALVTLSRIILVFVIVALFQRGFYLNALATILTGVIIAMDALDGYIARRYGETSAQGAVFDILGDRIVENVLWIYFACVGEYSFWVPTIVITRDVIVDNLRSMAFAEGKTAFGEQTMQKSEWAKFLVASRISRALYAASKGVCFTYLGLIITARSAEISPLWMNYLISFKYALVYGTVVFCLLRGFPVVWEGRGYLLGSRLNPPQASS
jgi:CDP-diacylglycerol--glycerol-3-phosphate 3-phosphatidyltransferase